MFPFPPHRRIPWMVPAALLCLWVITGILSCAPKPEEPMIREHALERLQKKDWPSFSNDMDPESLRYAVEQSLIYLDRLAPETTFWFGPDSYTAAHIARSHRSILDLLHQNVGEQGLLELIQSDFEVYRATGRRGDGLVLFTGYYEPVLEVSPTPSEEHVWPLHQLPPDLIRFPETVEPGGRTRWSVKRPEGDQLVPYFSRAEIEAGALAGRNLELGFAHDRVELFLMQVQGSGLIRFSDGTLVRVGYAGTNGHPYRSIGKILIDEGWIPKENMSMFAIRDFFKDHPQHMDRILGMNPSYVFFRVLPDGPYGNISVPLTPGRSIATDAHLFPKGALAYIETRKPLLNGRGEPESWSRFGRFVLNQDTGGAIKGAGRVDIFWGSGLYAEVAAAHLQHPGNLYFLVLKQAETPG